MGGHNRRPKRALVADIGGTNARFALADLSTLALGTCRQISCADHESLDAVLGDYLGALPERGHGGRGARHLRCD